MDQLWRFTMLLSSANVTAISVIAEQTYPIITPQTTKRAMLLSFLLASRTRPMESIAPQNAAATIAAEFKTIPFPRDIIITSATKSFAPEEIPRTKGPAIGFPKKVCSRYPETESPPPRMAAASKRGKRILRIMRAEVPSVCLRNRAEKASPGKMRVLPARRFSTRNIDSKITRMPKQPLMRLFPDVFPVASGDSSVFIPFLLPKQIIDSCFSIVSPITGGSFLFYYRIRCSQVN